MLIFLVYLFGILGAALILLAGVIEFRKFTQSSKLTKLLSAISSLNIKFTRTFITPNQSHLIALNESYKKIAIGISSPNTNKKATAKLYTFNDIMGSEIVVNALTFSKVFKRLQNSKTTASSADIHVVSDSVDSTNIIQELTLKIYLNSTETPIYYISFLPGKLPIAQSDAQYKEAYTQVQQLHALFKSIVSEPNV